MSLLDTLIYGYRQIIDSANVKMLQRSNVKYVGATIADDPVNNQTVITVTGGGGSVTQTPLGSAPMVVVKDVTAGSLRHRTIRVDGNKSAQLDPAGYDGEIWLRPTPPGWYNPMDYGCYFDGVHDDLPGLNAMLTAIRTARGSGLASSIIHLPASKGYCSDNLRIKDPVTFRGHGGSAIDALHGAASGIEFPPLKGVVLESYLTVSDYPVNGGADSTRLENIVFSSIQAIVTRNVAGHGLAMRMLDPAVHIRAAATYYALGRCVIVSGYGGGAADADAYAEGATREGPTVMFRVTTSGTTGAGATPAAFATATVANLGNTIADGTVVWTVESIPKDYVNNTAYVVGQRVLLQGDPQAYFECITAGTSAGTSIAVASNGQALPQSTINVGDATGFPASGQARVTTSAGFQLVSYTGKTGTTLTGCTGGTGTMSTGGLVTQPLNGAGNGYGVTCPAPMLSPSYGQQFYEVGASGLRWQVYFPAGVHVLAPNCAISDCAISGFTGDAVRTNSAIDPTAYASQFGYADFTDISNNVVHCCGGGLRFNGSDGGGGHTLNTTIFNVGMGRTDVDKAAYLNSAAPFWGTGSYGILDRCLVGNRHIKAYLQFSNCAPWRNDTFGGGSLSSFTGCIGETIPRAYFTTNAIIIGCTPLPVTGGGLIIDVSSGRGLRELDSRTPASPVTVALSNADGGVLTFKTPADGVNEWGWKYSAGYWRLGYSGPSPNGAAAFALSAAGATENPGPSWLQFERGYLAGTIGAEVFRGDISMIADRAIRGGLRRKGDRFESGSQTTTITSNGYRGAPWSLFASTALDTGYAPWGLPSVRCEPTANGATPAAGLSVWKVTTAGTTGASEPTWATATPGGGTTVGDIKTDGTVVWTLIGFTPGTLVTDADPTTKTVAALAIDWTIGGTYNKTLSAGSNTFTFVNALDGHTITIAVTGAASTLTWPGGIVWSGGSAPTQTASGTDVYTFTKIGTSIYGTRISPSSSVTIPTTVNGVVTSTGSALQQASNVLAGSGYLSLGAAPATTGAMRLANLTEVYFRDNANTSDVVAFSFDTSNELNVGINAAFTTTSQPITTNLFAGGAVCLGIGTATHFYIQSGVIQSRYPLVGWAAGSSPYGVHGMAVKAMAGSTSTLTAAEYSYYTCKVTGTGTNVIKYPAVTDATAYTKYVWNAGSGTLAVQDTNSVAAAATLAAGQGAVFQFSNAAVKQLTAAFTVA